MKRGHRGHQNHGLIKMAKAAMANLGGQATSTELIAEILRMPESSSLSSAMCTEAHRSPIILWQKSIGSMMGKWFETTDPSKTRGSAYRLRHKTTMPWRQENRGLMKMAQTAMANLGGEATSKELIAEILRMPESSLLSSSMSTDRRAPHILAKVWQRSLGTKMGRWFETTDPSGRRGVAYRLRPATA